MAPSLSRYLTRRNAFVSFGVSATVLWIAANRYRKQRAKQKQIPKEVTYAITQKRSRKIKAHVDREFLRQLMQLIKIVMPGWISVEAGYAAMVAAALVTRTLCDLWILSCVSAIESLLVSNEKDLFMRSIWSFLSSLPVISITNNILKYVTGELKIRMRENLSLHLYTGYLKNLTYYRLSNLDSRIPNADHFLTADVDKFCDGLAELYSNLSKPLLDIIIFSYKMSTSMSSIPPLVVLGYLAFAGILLTNFRKPAGHLTVIEQTLEGEYRHINTRIITYSEEIAFYNGNLQERVTLNSSFHKLIRHIRKFLYFRTLMGFLDNIIAKYCASVAGWISVSLPFVFVVSSYGMVALDISERSRIYYTYTQMLYKLALAVGRLVLSGRELTRLSGYTYRITQLEAVINDINSGGYIRTMIEGSDTFRPNAGKLIIRDNIIKFDKVPIVTPNGDVLIKELSVEIRSGMNVLVCGPNGAGKSSVFRILGELWPLFGGELTKPPSGKLFYVPQKPYMTLGTLRDQITYPHSSAEAALHGSTDNQLTHYLRLVELEYLQDREGGFDVVADWLDILSGGEKQRIAMARLFYHAPQFAILDECTSAVSIDIENLMYSYCREVGITLLTVSHRKSLWQHHEYALYLDGRGNYKFDPIVAGTEEFGS